MSITLEQVLAVVSTALEMPNVDANSTMDDLGATSVDLIAVLVGLEEWLGFKLPDDFLTQADTPLTALEKLRGLRKPETGSHG